MGKKQPSEQTPVYAVVHASLRTQIFTGQYRPGEDVYKRQAQTRLIREQMGPLLGDACRQAGVLPETVGVISVVGKMCIRDSCYRSARREEAFRPAGREPAYFAAKREPCAGSALRGQQMCIRDRLCTIFPCNTQSISAEKWLHQTKNPSLLVIFPVFR